MNQKKKFSIFYTLSLLVLLSGCASYHASSLSTLPQETALPFVENSGVWISCKKLGKEECKQYFDRDILAKGYTPLHLTIRNQGKDPIFFSPSNFSVPVAPAYEIAKKVHTSTGGRVAAWGAGGLLFFPLWIPAIVDGFKSAGANEALDADYAAKTLKDTTIQPHSSFNGVVFLPNMRDKEVIELFLVNQTTSEKISSKIFLNHE